MSSKSYGDVVVATSVSSSVSSSVVDSGSNVTSSNSSSWGKRSKRELDRFVVRVVRACRLVDRRRPRADKRRAEPRHVVVLLSNAL